MACVQSSRSKRHLLILAIIVHEQAVLRCQWWQTCWSRICTLPDSAGWPGGGPRGSMPAPRSANSSEQHPSQFHAQRSTGPGFQGQAPGPSHQYYHEPLPSKLLEQVRNACFAINGTLTYLEGFH